MIPLLHDRIGIKITSAKRETTYPYSAYCVNNSVQGTKAWSHGQSATVAGTANPKRGLNANEDDAMF